MFMPRSMLSIALAMATTTTAGVLRGQEKAKPDAAKHAHKHVDFSRDGRRTKRLVLFQKESAKAKQEPLDVYEAYAAWWKRQSEARKKAKKEWVKRDDQGKRQGRVFRSPLNPPTVSAAEAEEKGMVQDPTFVLGVSIGKEARAYPLYSMGELLNDTLGGVAIAASW